MTRLFDIIQSLGVELSRLTGMMPRTLYLSIPFRDFAEVMKAIERSAEIPADTSEIGKIVLNCGAIQLRISPDQFLHDTQSFGAMKYDDKFN